VRILLAILLLLDVMAVPLPAQEPDGSRAIGIVPPFRGEPAPPAWLRARSHANACVDTRHYLYEAYAGPEGQWLVRYVMLPDGDEAFREIEQAFLYTADEKKKPVPLKSSDIQVEPRAATWKKLQFTLVDRRDLLKP
jgi:hypothetical protein